MKKLLPVFVLFLSFSFASFAQSSFYIPLNVKKSYESGVRNYDGTPGKKYWQNSAHYIITAEINPATRILRGREEIVYKNNSPDELKKLVFRLYPDYYKKGAPRDDQINPKALTDGVKIYSLVINGDTVDFSAEAKSYRRQGTNLFVFLKNPLPPNSTSVVEAEWSFEIPKYSKQRMGAYDSTSFFVAYWYPQIAVYDDIDGWDVYNYGGTVEFYNDFNNYNVEISVPEGFLVWATGELQNADELLKPKYLRRLEEAMQSDSVVRIVTLKDYEKEKPTVDDDYNTWIFEAKNVTDFTFGTSNHYLWDMGSVVVDEKTGRRVTVDAAYKSDSEEFAKVAKMGLKTVAFLSKELPGVPFPYPKITIFNGGGGMESPMMVNEGASSSYTGQFFVTSHEITHTYFPFYMGINERKYAWMDEGWATMLPIELQAKEGKFNPLEMNAAGFSLFAGSETELPMIIPSVFLFGRTYRSASYGRPGLAYYYLMQTMGKENFKKALKEYIRRWHGKHPLPYDFFFTFNDVAGENLDWFFEPWFCERGYPDVSIDKVEFSEDSVNIVVRKDGLLPVPIDLILTFENGSKKEIYKTPVVWKNGNEKLELKIKTSSPPIKVELSTKFIPDVDKSHNLWEAKN
jgi:hypothetical protein